MNKFALLITVFLITLPISAQKIELKKDVILIDGKDTFNFKDKSGELTIYKLNTKEEIVFIRHNDNGTIGYKMYDDDYNVINFVSLKLKMETKKWHARWKNTVLWLYENGVLTKDGEIDAEKTAILIDKYSENLSGKN